MERFGEQDERWGPTAMSPPGPPPRRRRRKGLIISVVVILAVALLLGAGVLVDWIVFREKPKSSKEYDISESMSFREALSDIEGQFYRDVSSSALEKAAKEGVDVARKRGIKSPEKLEEAGLRAMADELDDSHSVYLNEEEAKSLNEGLSGSFYGVGFMLRMENERPKVVSLIPDAPAERDGIKKNDVVVKVDGKDTEGMDIEKIVTWIRGRKGTEVELEIEREGQERPLTFTLTREKIDIPDLEAEILDERYGHLKVLNFDRGLGQKVRDKTEELMKEGVGGFILDLRNNPGGLMDEGIELARVFINEGIIVSYQRKGEEIIEEMAKGNAVTDLPLVVLVNEGSASASEIVAGAIRDNGTGILVGEKTYGKGSVQKLYDLPNGGAMKLTVAMYYLPAGESIDGQGIEPDVPVDIPESASAEEVEQIQLQKAKEVLGGLVSTRSFFILPFNGSKAAPLPVGAKLDVAA